MCIRILKAAQKVPYIESQLPHTVIPYDPEPSTPDHTTASDIEPLPLHLAQPERAFSDVSVHIATPESLNTASAMESSINTSSIMESSLEHEAEVEGHGDDGDKLPGERPQGERHCVVTVEEEDEDEEENLDDYDENTTIKVDRC